jgi:hypothetical protein
MYFYIGDIYWTWCHHTAGVAVAVSCQPLTVEFWLVPGQSVAFVVDSLAQDRFVSEYLSFPLSLLFHRSILIHLSPTLYILSNSQHCWHWPLHCSESERINVDCVLTMFEIFTVHMCEFWSVRKKFYLVTSASWEYVWWSNHELDSMNCRLTIVSCWLK